ncbi:hypothetical protein ACU5AX_08860 [Sphingomonas sp. XXL09]|uniref:hypothetical protein n=1 Tax=Sphingomonas sp. XXL09 TaxID=3457787 RepID=UPI00406BB235
MSESSYLAAAKGRDTGNIDGVNGADLNDEDNRLVELAGGILASRRKLATRFDPALFANPGMDIMLFLFASGIHGATVTTNACCAAAGVPRTTALRWIKLLQDRGLVEGSDDAADRRVTMLALTGTGRDTLRDWLNEIIEAHPTVAAMRG